jgi:hypothetical protein
MWEFAQVAVTCAVLPKVWCTVHTRKNTGMVCTLIRTPAVAVGTVIHLAAG